MRLSETGERDTTCGVEYEDSGMDSKGGGRGRGRVSSMTLRLVTQTGVGAM